MLKDVITGQAMILALCPFRRGKDDAAISGATLGQMISDFHIIQICAVTGVFAS
jgi:hypothetical protein